MSNQVRCKVSLGQWLRAARFQIPGLQPQREGGARRRRRGREGLERRGQWSRGAPGAPGGLPLRLLSSPQAHLCAQPRGGGPDGCSLQCRWVPSSRDRSVPPSLLPARRACERAEPGPGGLCLRLGGRRVGRALGTCCAAAASPGRASCVTALPGSACDHVTRLVVRAGVRPPVLSTLPPAPTPASFLRLSPSSDASSRKPSEKSRACGNLFVERGPHPLHSLQLDASGQPWPGSPRTPFVCTLSTATLFY